MRFGNVRLGTPVVLAPMAGVTNPPFRRLCRESGEAGLRDGDVPDSATGELMGPSGLYVTEMITSRALVERTPITMRMIQPDAGDPVRSVQLYGVDPATVAAAVRILVGEDRADHIDLNFGCPVPKVTRKGGGAALPWKRDLFEAIVTNAVGNSGDVPVTVKMRMGIDDDHITFLDAGRIAKNAGVAAVALHARTAAQHYSGDARWNEISRLKDALGDDIPVLGNGDIWSAEDALAMMKQTGCDGVVIGRGCQGRPWLFTDVVAAMHGRTERVRPSLREVGEAMVRHAALMAEHFEDELRGVRELRKHVAWYLKGYRVGGQLRHDLARVSSLDELRELLSELELDQPFPEDAEGRRGRGGGEKVPKLPDGWLDSPCLSEHERERINAAELDVSGG